MDIDSLKVDSGPSSQLTRGIQHTRVNQELFKVISEEAIDSSAKIIEKIADQLNLSKEYVVRKIYELKRKRGFIYNLDDATREILNALLKVEDTHNYFEDIAKSRDKILSRENPNKIFISRK